MQRADTNRIALAALGASLVAIPNPVRAHAQPITLTVSTTQDSGPGSLREAITLSNATTERDSIVFSIPPSECDGEGVCSITPLVKLPQVTNAILDATTQPGAGSCDPFPDGLKIEVSGRNLETSATDDHGLTVDSSFVKGFVINQFTNGVFVTGATSRVECSFIGTDPTGAVDKGNSFYGIEVRFDRAVISNNLVSGNGASGILVNRASGSFISGNRVGTDVTGMFEIGNDLAGIEIQRAEDVVVGVPPAVPVSAAQKATEPCSPLGNLVSGNGRLRMSGDPLGLQSDAGIFVDTASNNYVLGNCIGTTADGTAPIPNQGPGISIWNGFSDGNQIGGPYTGWGNTIAFNGKAGISIVPRTDLMPVGNAVSNNSFALNTGIGIDLGDDGITPNDLDDADDGANRFQNTPEIASAMGDDDASITIKYRVTSDTAYSEYPITAEFFIADAGRQEGRVFVGKGMVSAVNAGSDVQLSFNPAVDVTDGSFIVATATDAAGNTSEFSGAVTIIGGARHVGTTAPSGQRGWGLEVYPNPTVGRFTVDFVAASRGVYSVDIVHPGGRTLGKLWVGWLKPATEFRVDGTTEGLASGVYFIRVIGPAGPVTRALIVAR